MIQLLIQCGAHLHETPHQLGEKLCTASASGNIRRLESLFFAGADLNQANASGVTAMQQAIVNDKPKVVKFLLDHQVSTLGKRGLTPRQLAELMNSEEVLKLLSTNITNGIKT
uniref:Uncharacterized protein n=1 Tax=Bracon brevicornis TaxID=1563983 RepID=A0A6V7J569_9HYME